MSIANTEYIVTGAAGFIGSAVVWGLNRRGIDDVLIVDHLGESEKWKNLRALRFADYMEKDDFLRAIDTDGLPSSVKAVIHLGACSSTTQLDASYLVHNNFEYTKRLATHCAARGIRFIYASSAATYGAGERGYSDDLDGIPALRPLNMYGYSKQMFDLWAIRTGLVNSIAGMKFTNVFGPNERHKGSMRSMVCRAFEQIRDSGSVKLFKSCRPEYADGEQKRDFVYVKDIVEMILFLLDRPVLCGIFNAGSGRAETWNELVSAVFDAMEKPRRIEYIDMPEILKGKYQYYTCADMAKLRGAGFTGGRTPLAEAVADYVRGYLIPDKHLGDEPFN
jgi:ADP-L-glycero-D-manno-heptose 6-epimerase